MISEMTSPATSRIGIRMSQLHRATLKRLLNRKMSGVRIAHNHDSMYAMAIGAAGDVMRRP